jgi:crotonobetainyl-CoA:carnitine CoA-transferase CaiB-like acyl-CoA transferase
MPGALEDIRVIDFTHALNGPFCTMMLGHLGAEIIKIEPPTGDGFRRSWMPPNAKVDAYEFLWVTANKKSVVLNLKDPRGADLARQLIAKADVVVENYHTGTMEKFGLGYEDLKKINPRIIYSCSRGFGETGPYKDYGSYGAHQQQHDRLDPHRLGLQQSSGNQSDRYRRRSRRRQHGVRHPRRAARTRAYRRRSRKSSCQCKKRCSVS